MFAFDLDSSSIPFLKRYEIFLDFWFLTEIALNFITGYFDKGILVMDRKLIFLSYMRTWFWLDIFSSIPFSFVYFSGGGNTFTNLQALKSAKLIRIFRMAKYARLVRLLRFLKVNKLM